MQIAQKMLDFGIQTQQGYLRMRTASDLYTVKDETKKCVIYSIVCYVTH